MANILVVFLDFEEVLKQLDFFHDLPKLTCAGQELENAIAAFVSECSLIHDSKGLCEYLGTTNTFVHLLF